MFAIAAFIFFCRGLDIRVAKWIDYLWKTDAKRKPLFGILIHMKYFLEGLMHFS